MYKKAEDIFPKEVLEMIQEYVDGEYIYIPKRENTRRKWGESTSLKKELKQRNENIINDYINKLTKAEIASKYFLSLKSIDKIISSQNVIKD